jgi:hypothetical protein
VRSDVQSKADKNGIVVLANDAGVTSYCDLICSLGDCASDNHDLSSYFS